MSTPFVLHPTPSPLGIWGVVLISITVSVSCPEPRGWGLVPRQVFHETGRSPVSPVEFRFNRRSWTQSYSGPGYPRQNRLLTLLFRPLTPVVGHPGSVLSLQKLVSRPDLARQGRLRGHPMTRGNYPRRTAAVRLPLVPPRSHTTLAPSLATSRDPDPCPGQLDRTMGGSKGSSRNKTLSPPRGTPSGPDSVSALSAFPLLHSD